MSESSEEPDAVPEEPDPLPEQLDPPPEQLDPLPEQLDPPPEDPLRDLRAVLDGAAEGITRPDADAENAARAQVGSGMPAAGRLGRLAEWAIWLSGVQGTFPPRALERVGVLVVGTEPPLGHPMRELMDQPGVSMDVVALQPDSTVTDAAEAGAAAVDAAADGGCDLLILPALVADEVTGTLVALLLRLSATEVVGDSPHLDDAAWAELVAGIRDRTRQARPLQDDPVALLDAVGSRELAALVAMLLRAAARRTPVLLDGAADTAAALCASRCAILGSWWWLAASRSNDPATTRATDALGLEPVTDLAAHLDGGATALIALPLLRAAQVTALP